MVTESVSSTPPSSIPDSRGFFSTLADPPEAFRPSPLFVFNEEHEGVMGEARITEMLEKLKSTGFGGVYIHPRPGLITEYLSERWFELVRYTVKECRRIGLVASLYDENSYPSGFGGGNVPGRAPDTRSRYFKPTRGTGAVGVPPGALAVFRMDDGMPAGRIEVKEIGPETEWLAVTVEDMPGEPFLGEGPYVSLLDPLTTKTFLETTHARYHEALDREDWESLGSIFTDEPHLPGASLGPWSIGLHGNLRVLAAFQRRYGYDLLDRIADLFFDSPTSAGTRFDFYELLHALWLDSWAQPLSDWCGEHGIRLTGHYLEHDWPAPYATPGQMHLLSRLDWPGTDFLECFELLGHDFYDPQGFEAAEPGQEPLALFYLKQVKSVANQYGKERVMDESWGAGGHDATPVDWLRIGRFLAVHGVDHFVPHHTLQTISGVRKQDHPQFFSDQIPVFEHLGPMNDELARLSLLGARGIEKNRILFLDPLTSGYLAARKADALEAGEGLFEEGDVLAGTIGSLLPLRRSACGLAQSLSDALFDFDIGDEYVLEERGSVDSQQLRVGECSYRCLVWPEGLCNLRSATVDLLENYLKAGGVILGRRPDQFFIDGRGARERLQEWEHSYPDGLRFFGNNPDLLEALETCVPRRLRFETTPETAPKTGLAAAYRETEDWGGYYLLHNAHPAKDVTAVPLFAETPQSVTVYNPENHTAYSLEKGAALHLPANKAVVLIPGRPEGLEAVTAPETIDSEDVHSLLRPELIDAQPAAPNVLVVDRCELEVSGVRHELSSVYLANQRYWRAQGFSGNGWFMRVQTQGNLVRRDPFFTPGSGGRVCYRFEMDPSTPTDSIRLAMEKPEQWTVALNGQVLDFSEAESWRDPRIVALPVGAYLQAGSNECVLSADRFAVRQEIDSIYLLGDFAVEPAASGFRIAGPLQPLSVGSWRAGGLPFYDEAVDYRFALPKGSPGGVFRLGADDWSGACMELRHGDRRELAYGPAVAWRIDAADGPEFVVRITGLAKNLFGPWHVASRPRKRAWATFWRCDGLTLDEPRPGADYDLLDLGLLENRFGS